MNGKLKVGAGLGRDCAPCTPPESGAKYSVTVVAAGAVPLTTKFGDVPVTAKVQSPATSCDLLRAGAQHRQREQRAEDTDQGHDPRTSVRGSARCLLLHCRHSHRHSPRQPSCQTATPTRHSPRRTQILTRDVARVDPRLDAATDFSRGPAAGGRTPGRRRPGARPPRTPRSVHLGASRSSGGCRSGARPSAGASG